MTRIATFLILAPLACAAAASSDFHSPMAIDDAIERTLGRPVGVAGGAAYRVDPRLRLAACPVTLKVDTAIAGWVDVRCEAIGWRVRVPLTAASTSQANASMAVRRGESVRIVLRGSGFEIATSGVALEDGVEGATLRVRSLTDGSILRASVTDDGIVELRD